jgi:hypothetical protein
MVHGIPTSGIAVVIPLSSMARSGLAVMGCMVLAVTSMV